MFLRRTNIAESDCSFVKNFNYLSKVYATEKEIEEKIKKQKVWVFTYTKD
jgi:hypothetical protein